MTGAALADALIAAGLDPSERAGKQALFTAILEMCAARHLGAPERAWWVPGRIEVFGKHTDYAGGRALVSAVTRGFGVVAAARQDRTVTVTDAWRGYSDRLIPVPTPTSRTRSPGWIFITWIARSRPG